MADESRSKIIKVNPIGKGLDTFRDSFELKCRGLAIQVLMHSTTLLRKEGTAQCQIREIF